MWRYRWVHAVLIVFCMMLVSLVVFTHQWRWMAMLDHIALDEYFRLRGAHRPAEVAEALPYT
ncbi:MAG: hypothetical protein JOZ57_09760, partial [Abitibacteriaceae bacterium]|nr:hypothetical protein [Abditibacteriaceae bacterium]